MPNASDFLAGFGLTRRTEIGGYILNEVHSTHVSIKRYQEYRYDITLTFINMGSGIYEKLLSGLRSLISGEHIIYGIRNPYRCVIDPIQHGDISEDTEGIIVIQLTGHSYRA